MAETLAPAVVAVTTTVKDVGPRDARLHGLGSGIVVDRSGAVLTNAHVVQDAQQVEIELSDHRRLPARIVFADPLVDLALLQIEGDATNIPNVSFTSVSPRPGTPVMAVGQPYGLGNTVTVGVVSGIGRDHRDLGRPRGLRSDGAWSFIQTDAPINIGNSGGPLVDPHGHVLGITTAVRVDAQGVGFAIPSAMALRFLEEVAAFGRLRHPRLGIHVEPDVVTTDRVSVPVIRITDVDATGPAAKAGLLPNDLVLAVRDQPVRRLSELAYLTQLSGVGTPLALRVQRAGQEGPSVVSVTPTESP